MMTRVFLAAGVAALAIAAPASAGPHNDRGGQAFAVQRGGGGGGGQRAQVFAAPQRAQRVQQFSAPRMQRQAFAAPRIERQQRMAAIERPQRIQQAQAMRAERMQARPQRIQQVQAMRAERMQARPQVQNRFAQRQQLQQNRLAQRHQVQQNRFAQRQQVQQNRLAQRQQLQANRVQVQQNRMAERQQLQANRLQVQQDRMAQRQQLRGNAFANGQVNGQFAGRGYGVGGCPPGLANKSVACMPPGQAAKLGLGGSVITAANVAALRNAQVDTINARYGTRIVAPSLATSLIGAPINAAPSVLGMSLNPIPQSISYLYPSTPNYYYQYGDGYLYQVDRSTSLIDALIPLLAGGYMPGSYLPQPYMSSYVPDYYGLNSFYPASYADYGGDYADYYGNTCNRYANGVIYQVDCMTGMVDNVIPMYAGGYGVGQMLPAAYNTYNVPYQYRDMYAPTSDYSYWYAPGAIYQVDPSSSMITSVAALLSPGFSVGQPLPMGYDTYNVPYAYRSTYYDTPNAWYRYNNGYIYQVDPASQLVTAIVASLLT